MKLNYLLSFFTGILGVNFINEFINIVSISNDVFHLADQYLFIFLKSLIINANNKHTALIISTNSLNCF